MSSGNESKKTKTQKRNAQKAKASKGKKGGENHSNKQQAELHRLVQENKEMRKKQDMFEAAQKQFRDVMKMTPGTPSYDPNFKPSPASAPTLDEKYVAIPSKAEVAVSQLSEALVGTVISKDGGRHLMGTSDLVAKLDLVKEALKVKPEQKKMIKVPDIHSSVFKMAKVSLPIGLGELAVVKAALRGGLKDKPIKASLRMSFTITTTVTTGVTAATSMGGNANGIRLDNATEWSSYAALFDEVKCTGGHVDFIYKNPTKFDPTGAASAAVSNDLPVIGYDPADRAVPTSSITLTELSQHKIITNALTIDAKTNVYVPQMAMQHHFKFHVPPGTMTGDSSDGWVGSQWLAIDSVPSLYIGKIKFYHVGSIITAIDTGAGIIFLNCEFRCRE
jgi:hypothetical protein